MANAPNRNSSRRRPFHSQGARIRSESARPPFSSSPQTEIPPAGLSARRNDGWTLSPDGHWFVHEIDDPSAAARIELGRRVIDLGRLLDCPARWEIEKERVIVRVAADRRGHALISALRGELEQDLGMAS